MFAVPDFLAGLFLVCFLIGLVYILISAFLGFGHDVLHIGGAGGGDGGAHVGDDGGAHFGQDVGAHVGDAGHFAGHADASAHAGFDGGAVGAGHHGADGTDVGHAASTGGHGSTPTASPINLLTIMGFLTWFGGAGYIFYVELGLWAPFSLLLAVAPGVLAGWLLYLFLVKVILAGTATRDPADFQIVGKLGHLTLAIPENGLGEVIYTMGGSRHSDGARSGDGAPIPKGAEVVIVEYDKGIALVEPWNSFVEKANERQSIGRRLRGG